MTTVDKNQTTVAAKEKKAIDRLVAWRSADKQCIAQKGDPQLRSNEYRERGKLRDIADELPPRNVEGGQP